MGEAAAASQAGASLAAQPPKQVSTRNKRRFFVSNIRPTVSANEMAKHLQTMGVRVCTVHKLRTKVSAYTSFCAEVSVQELKTLCDPARWASNIVFKEYRGRPHPAQIVETFDESA